MKFQESANIIRMYGGKRWRIIIWTKSNYHKW